MNLIGAITLADSTPKTLLELLAAMISARTFDADASTNTTMMKAQLNRSSPLPAGEVFVEATGDFYMVDAYKGVNNGAVDATKWAAADFTTRGAKLIGGINRRIGNGADMGQRVVYQNTGAPITFYFDITSN
jgi:hypothetical protein